MGLILNHLSASKGSGLKDGQSRFAVGMSGSMIFNPSAAAVPQYSATVFSENPDAAYIFSGTIAGVDKALFLGDVVISGSLNTAGGGMVGSDADAADRRVAFYNGSPDTISGDTDLQFLAAGSAFGEFSATFDQGGLLLGESAGDDVSISLGNGDLIVFSGDSADTTEKAGLYAKNDRTLAISGTHNSLTTGRPAVEIGALGDVRMLSSQAIRIIGGSGGLTGSSMTGFGLTAFNDSFIQQSDGLLFVNLDGTDATDGLLMDIESKATIQAAHASDGAIVLNAEHASGQINLQNQGNAKVKIGADDVVVSANIGVVLGAASEKIEGNSSDLTVASGQDINLTATRDVVIPSGVGLVLDGTGNEKIESDGTDINIAVGANGDVNLGSSIGLTFGDDGEKIEGDGTDLTVASSGLLNLSPNSDVVIPVSKGLIFGNGDEKIESDNSDFTINSGGDINLTAAAGDINVPSGIGLTFGNDGEKIEGDGTDLAIASSGDLDITAVLVDVTGAGAFSGNLTVGGNLDVNGTTTTIDTEQMQIQDSIIGLGYSGSDSSMTTLGDRGILFGLGLVQNNQPGMRFTAAGGFEFGAFDALPSSASLGSANGYFGVKAQTLTANGITDNHVVHAGTGGLLEGSTSFTFDGNDLQLANAVGLVFSTDDAEKIESDGADLTVASGGDIHLTAATDVNLPNNVGMVFGDDGEKIEGNGTDLTVASSAKINLTAVSDVIVPDSVGILFGDVATGGEKIEGDGTDLTIASSAKLNLTATSDVIVPDSVGILFGDVATGGEKIEGDGTDLTIASSAKLNLTATTDVILPDAVGMLFGDVATGGEKIEGDGTDLTIASSNLLNLTATTDVVVPANVGMIFGDAAEKIEGNGTKLTIASSDAIDLTATTDVVLPANVGMVFGDAGEKIEGNGTNLSVASSADLSLTAGGSLVITAASGMIPGDDNSVNLGSATRRFANIFTGDLNLRNDRGDWTLIEESDFLSFRNNSTGRRFRMVMEDITGTGTYGPGNDGEM